MRDSAERRGLLRAVALAERRQLGSARRAAREAVTETCRDAGALLAAGMIAYVTRDYQDALTLLDRAGAAGASAEACRARLDCAARLGWDQDARRAILDGIAMGGADEAEWQARALAIFSRRRVLERAIAHGVRAAELHPGSIRIELELANLYVESGHEAEALASIRRALAIQGVPLHARIEGARLLIVLGQFDDARDALEAALAMEARAASALEMLGSLALWAGRDEDAERFARRALEQDDAHAPATRLLGALAATRGDAAGARGWLERALALDPKEPEAHLWIAQLAFDAGDIDRAGRHVPAAIACAADYYFAAQLLALQVGSDVAFSEKLPLGEVSHLVAGVTAVCPELAAGLVGCETRKWEAACAATLARLRGNRSVTPTHLPGGALTLVRTGEGPRYAARRALETIRIMEPDYAMRELDRVVAQFPHSSLALAHHGELSMWLGRLDEARATLERAVEVTAETRWAYIGLTTVDVLTGHAERALATSAHGVATMRNIEGPAVYVARGEALRVLGRHQEAVVDLERAVALHPARISAWLNLGLAHLGRGESERAAAIVMRLVEQAPGLASDAARELGVALHGDSGRAWGAGDVEPLLRRMLEMLRGNRSSTCVTYFTSSGSIRTVYPGPQLASHAHAHDMEDLARARLVLERAG